MLAEHYQLLATGYRHVLPTDRLYDIRLDYHQEGEGDAVQLLGAVYDAWRANYQPPALPVFGPFLAGQTPDQVPTHVYTRLERQALIAQACAQLKAQQRQRYQERRPQTILPAHLGEIVLSDYAQEVIGSYIVQEVTAQQAKRLLVCREEDLLSSALAPLR